MEGVPLDYKTHCRIIAWAAHRSISVESVVREAVRTYIEDVDLGLLPEPEQEPACMARLRSRG